MAKAPDLVVAVFEKPYNCRRCPCAYYSESPFSDDICQLKQYMGGFDSDCELSFEHGVESPDWCPLTDVKFVPG